MAKLENNYAIKVGDRLIELGFTNYKAQPERTKIVPAKPARKVRRKTFKILEN